MSWFLPLLIVAIHPESPIVSRYPEATEVFSCNFDASWDKNFDDWPDNWTRRRGPGFPSYVKVLLGQEPAPSGRRFLRIDLDGAAAVAYSPPIAIRPCYSYVVEGSLRTEGLEHDKAFFSLTLLDSKLQRLETFYSEKAGKLPQWKEFRFGPVSPSNDQARVAVIGLHLEPGAKADLHGSALFDDIWLGRLPRMSLTAEGHRHIFTDPGQITLLCTASGFADGNPRVMLVLEDAFGHKIAETQPTLQIQKSEESAEVSSDASAANAAPRIGTTTWKPPVPGPGFYRVWALMNGREATARRQGMAFVVIEETSPPKRGEFGWSLPRGANPMTLPELAPLLCQAGINWVKYPVWFDQGASDEAISQLVNFNEQLASRGVTMVGMLCQPPEKVREQCGPSESISAAEVFSSNPNVWYPSLELVMMRLATLVRWWQLGTDTDRSFVGYPDLAQTLSQVKLYLDRVGQDVNLGFGWDWMVQLPQSRQTPPWQFLSLSSQPPLTDAELESYLTVTERPGLKRWVVLEPLPDERYTVESRVCDLVRRMMTAKIHGADAVFIPDPFDPQCGLMREDGTPGELLLPWRTTALMLAGAEYAGHIQLPLDSRNEVFTREGGATMVVWNRQRVRETAHFGDDLRQVDLWSRNRVPQQEANRQVIEVGPMPTFVTGLELPLVRWRQSCSLAKDRIPSVFGLKHENSLQWTNSFGVAVSGEVKLVMPETWTVRPDRAEFRLAAGEQFRMPFELTLPFDATSGRHKLQADFTVRADKTYQFSAYQRIDVGLGDVHLECTAQLKDNGELEVEQRLSNETAQPVSFRCELLVPDRVRMQSEVLNLQQGSNARTYRLGDGQTLLGKTLWLRAEEIGGSRVLNCRFQAKP